MKKQILIWGLLLLISTAYGQELQFDSTSNLNYIIREGDESKPTIVMIHGYGTNEKDLYFISNFFPENTFICLQGNLKYGPNAYSWYDIEFHEDGTKTRNIAQAKQSKNQILSFIKQLKQNNTKVIVAGFSQGAILSVQIALENPHEIDGAIGLSGMLIDDDITSKPQYKAHYESLSVFYAHGIHDKILAIDEGRKCKNALTKAGIDLTYFEYPTAHKMIEKELQDLVKWYKNNY